ncbi:MAG: hypothetical protein K2X48_07930 [Chitinophagaceae bacterium]|nr:hypothetical protein [Chitinophagaceae bacterium]
MAVVFRIEDDAQIEFEEAVLRYELTSKGLGERFASIILKKFFLIERVPPALPCSEKWV